MNICSHCGSRIIDADVTIHESCVGPALVERRRLRAEIAGRVYVTLLAAEIHKATIADFIEDLARAGGLDEADMIRERAAVAHADALLAALDAKPPEVP